MDLKTTGNFTQIENKKYIIYKEYSDKSPEEYTINTLKLVDSEVATLIKNNSQQTRMIFEKNKRHYCPYYTEFGTLTFGIFTNNIHFNGDELSGKLFLSYTLDMNSSLISECELNLNFKKIK